MLQRDGGRAAVGEEFEAADFVNDGTFGGSAEQVAHAVRHDEGAGGGFERFNALEDAYVRALAREERCREQSGGGTADDRNSELTRLLAVQRRESLNVLECHAV